MGFFPVLCGVCGALSDRTVTAMVHRDHMDAADTRRFQFDPEQWVEMRWEWDERAGDRVLKPCEVRSGNATVCPACEPTPLVQRVRERERRAREEAAWAVVPAVEGPPGAAEKGAPASAQPKRAAPRSAKQIAAQRAENARKKNTEAARGTVPLGVGWVKQ